MDTINARTILGPLLSVSQGSEVPKNLTQEEQDRHNSLARHP
jgi:hypothetical protein